jgi:hypothetical protein
MWTTMMWGIWTPPWRLLKQWSISGSVVKHPLTRLSMLAFCEHIKFDNANSGRTPACVLALRGYRKGVSGERGGVIKVSRLIVKLESQP